MGARRAHQPEVLAVEAGGMPGGAQVLAVAKPYPRRDPDGLGRMPGMDRVVGNPSRPIDRNGK